MWILFQWIMSNWLQISNKLLNSGRTSVLFFFRNLLFQVCSDQVPTASPLHDSFVFLPCLSDSLLPLLFHPSHPQALSLPSPCLHLLLLPCFPRSTSFPSPSPPPPTVKLWHTMKEAILGRSHPETAYCFLLTQQKQQTIITLIHPHRTV